MSLAPGCWALIAMWVLCTGLLLALGLGPWAPVAAVPVGWLLTLAWSTTGERDDTDDE